jgi:hypothetical protein
MEQKVLASIEKQLGTIFDQRLDDGAQAKAGAPKREVSIRKRMGEVDEMLSKLYGDKGRVKSQIRHLLDATFQDGFNGNGSDAIPARVAKAVQFVKDYLTTKAPAGKVGETQPIKDKYALATEG